MKIIISADGRKLCASTGGQPLTSGSVGIEAAFVLSADYDGLAVTAVFRAGDVSVDVLLTGPSCTVPWEVLETSGHVLIVGVVGKNGSGEIVIPTIWGRVGMVECGTVAEGIDPQDPTPDIAAQLLQIAQENVARAETAETTATEAATAAGESATAAGEAKTDAESAAQDAEAWAVGKRGGTDVGSTDPAYHNNAKYYAEEVEEAAPFYAVYGQSTKSEIYAALNDKRQVYVKYNGMVIPFAGRYNYGGYSPSVGYRFALTINALQYVCTLENTWRYVVYDLGEPARRAEDAAAAALNHMNSADQSAQSAAHSASDASRDAGTASGAATTATTKAGEASDSATAADGSAKDAEAYAVGKRGGTDVGSSDPAYHNNAKYYAEQASGSAIAAGNAQTAAETAQGKAEDAQEAAEQAQSGAEAAAQSVSQSAAQISQNASDISDLKSAKAPVIIDTASGTIASFEDGADGMPIKALTVNIEPVQEGSGDPSPENVRPITGWTGCNVTRTGKNLLPDLTFQQGTNYVYIGQSRSQANYDVFLKAGQYTIHTMASQAASLYYKGKNNSANTKIDDSALEHNATFDINQDGWYQFYLYNQNGIAVDQVSSFQLEVGNSFTGCEAYQVNAYPITFPDSAGTVYGGTLELPSCVLTVDRAMVNMGDMTWKYYSGSGGYLRSDSITDRKLENDLSALCSIYLQSFASSLTSTPDHCFLLDVERQRIYVKDSDYTDGDVFKTAMNGQKMVYILGQPISVTLTTTEIETLLGQNNIWADCGPVSVDYPADTKLFIQKVNKPTDDDMTADTQIASGKYFIIGNNLYLSTTTIPAGDTINPGTNCTKTDLAAALNALNA